ncbi:hypothetical protein MKY96_33035 [Paenibacillus sp. FSL R7-0302]|uniref:hypothetical protein n=1 Tax=Paenibacillus sp. FSL R7-0302 TaxID=2921681 RepID=UPI0030F97ACC
MKKLLILFLSACLLLVAVPLAGATGADNVGVDEVEKGIPLVNDRIVNILTENNIDFIVSDGTLKLVDTSPEVLTEVNNLLVLEFKNSSFAARSYPTPYTHMGGYDRYVSSKFTAATEYALGAAVTEFVKSKGILDPWKVGAAAGMGYGVYYFIHRNEENLFFKIQYFYRELGAGYFDANGNFMGDYELLKEIHVTNNSDYSGGVLSTDARRSTIIDPWF